MAKLDTTYNPAIAALIEKTSLDWGDPLANRVNLIPYGIKHIDLALFGIDASGEFIVVQGPEKSRKTTFLLNVITNIFTWKPGQTNKPVVNWDSLETGMRPEKVRDYLISIMATRYLVDQGHSANTRCQVCGSDRCSELGISPKFLRYNTRTQRQKTAIEFALDVIAGWSLTIHGPSGKQGATRNLSEAPKRWKKLIDDHGVNMLVVDHIQQYNVGASDSDYEKQLAAVGTLGDFCAEYGLPVFAVSQVSMGSLKESQVSGSRLVAAGGAKAAQEANTVFSIRYNETLSKVVIKIEEAREAGSFSVFQGLDVVSGSFIGDPTTQLE
jgi:hypothetical protein